jgi:GNAT superfamily N-acetyltransferase
MSRTIRNLELAEVATLLDWAAAEGWNPGLKDAVAFQAADPTGFFGAFVDGAMVAAISAVAYDAHFGFIGLYICHPDWRGQGHGRAVWDAGMSYLGGRTIGLDGVAEQQANYASMGFVPAYETVRMSGDLSATILGGRVRLTAAAEDIRQLDRKCFPAERDGFLRHWLAPPNHCAVVEGPDGVSAFGVVRQCRDGCKIGPLFAADTHQALEIVETQSGLLHIDVPGTQAEWLAALSSRGFRDGFRTQRMYRGRRPEVHMPSIFGVSSLELG